MRRRCGTVRASVCGLTRRLLSGTNIPPLRLDGLPIRAIRYIRKNYHRPLDLTDIANHLHVNSAYLSHVFKRGYQDKNPDILRKN